MVECRAIHPVVQVRILTRPLSNSGEEKEVKYMANGLKRTANGLRANGLLANGLKRSARLANGLLATGAVSWLVSLF